MRAVTRLRGMLSQVVWTDLALAWFECPACHGKRPALRLRSDEIGIRCLVCRASAVSLSLIAALREQVPDLSRRHVFEMSARGPLYHYLRRHAGKLHCSEYFPGVAPGTLVNGVECQDAQALNLASGQFDLCTSTEVFEHVADDHRAFQEMHRVLAPGGLLLFSVPIDPKAATLERARLLPDGTVQHLLPPEYHLDPHAGHQGILAFRTYGGDITQRLLDAGFSAAAIIRPDWKIPWDHARPVVLARR